MTSNKANKGIHHKDTWLRNILRPMSDAVIGIDAHHHPVLINTIERNTHIRQLHLRM